MEEKRTFGERIKSEREKIGISQAELGEKSDKSRKTVLSWEASKTSPDICQLQLMNSLGMDVTYIITGDKVSGNLSDDEKQLIESYHNASGLLKTAALNVLISEPITMEEYTVIEEEEHFCEGDRLKVTAMNQTYINSEGRVVRSIEVPIAEFKEQKALEAKQALITKLNQLSEESQKRIVENIENALYREQQEAELNKMMESAQAEPQKKRRPRL